MFNRSVNKATLVGNLGKDPELKYTQSGSAIANFSIATTESWKNKQTGEYENKSEWHNIVVFGKFAELVGQYIKKGAKVYIEGKLQTNSRDDATSGPKRYKTEIIASDIQMLDKNDQQGQGAPQQQGGYQQQPRQQQWNNAPQQPPAQQAAPQMAPAYQPQQAPQQAPQPQGYGGGNQGQPQPDLSKPPF